MKFCPTNGYGRMMNDYYGNGWDKRMLEDYYGNEWEKRGNGWRTLPAKGSNRRPHWKRSDDSVLQDYMSDEGMWKRGIFDDYLADDIPWEKRGLIRDFLSEDNPWRKRATIDISDNSGWQQFKQDFGKMLDERIQFGWVYTIYNFQKNLMVYTGLIRIEVDAWTPAYLGDLAYGMGTMERMILRYGRYPVGREIG